jgi:hypothetical protein
VRSGRCLAEFVRTETGGLSFESADEPSSMIPGTVIHVVIPCYFRRRTLRHLDREVDRSHRARQVDEQVATNA